MPLEVMLSKAVELWQIPGGITKPEEERKWEFCSRATERGPGTEPSPSYTWRAPGSNTGLSGSKHF